MSLCPICHDSAAVNQQKRKGADDRHRTVGTLDHHLPPTKRPSPCHAPLLKSPWTSPPNVSLPTEAPQMPAGICYFDPPCKTALQIRPGSSVSIPLTLF